ncbi:MAG TPA: hypothetical protein VII76_06775 [Acidimicrobiales bacterium]
MSQFVDECRREWRRLGVPDPIANEMAADLTADLEEAEAEGGTAEDVLGNSAFDPRRFAAAWAAARGVTSPPTLDSPSRWRRPMAIALPALVGVLVVGAGLLLLVGRRSSAFAVVTHRIVAGPGPIRLFGPGAGRIVIPGPLGRTFVGSGVAGVDVHPLAVLLLFVGLGGLGLLAVLYWSFFSGSRRYRRHDGPRTPGWN